MTNRFLCIHGDEPFLIDEHIQRLACERDVSVDWISFSGLFSLQDFMMALTAIDMFSRSKYVVVKDPFFLSAAISDSDFSILKLCFESVLNGPNRLVLYWTKGSLDSRKRIVKLIKKFAEMVVYTSFKAWELDKLGNWISQRVHGFGKSVSSDALMVLVSCCGNDIRYLANELAKLDVYTGERSCLEKEDVMAVCPLAQSTIFVFTDAIASRNYPLALEACYKLLKNKQDPFALFGLFVSQIRTFYLVLDGLAKGESLDNLAGQLRKHPFVLKKLLPVIRKGYSVSLLMAIYADMAAVDGLIKTGKLRAENGLLRVLYSISKTGVV